MKRTLVFICMLLVPFALFACENYENDSCYSEDSYTYLSSSTVEQSLLAFTEPIIENMTEPVTETILAVAFEFSEEIVSETKEIIYITPTGKKYHKSQKCAGKNAIEIEIEIAIERGKTACKKCVK